MSVSFIDLSSDEELEIFDDKKNYPTTNCSPKIASSAVEKLQRNCSIELTIDLENSQPKKENELTISRTQGIIGFASVNILQRNHNSTPKHVLNGTTVPQKNSITDPDVIIIDSDEVRKVCLEKPKEVYLQKPKEVYPERPKGKTELASVKEVHAKSNINTQKASKAVVKDDDEVFIIDDDEEDVAGCTVQPSKKPLNIPAVKNEDLSQPNQTSVNKPITKISLVDDDEEEEEKNQPKSEPILPQNKPESTISTSKLLTPTVQVTPLSKSDYMRIPTVVLPLSSVFSSAFSSTTKSDTLCHPSTKKDKTIVLSDETEQKKESTRELRPRQKPDNQKAPATQQRSQSLTKGNSNLRDSNGNSSGPSTSKTLISKVDSSSKVIISNVAQERINKYSVENMFDGLVKVCCKLFQDENLGTRLWRYFRSASEDVLKSEDFLNALKLALKSAEDDKKTTMEDKLIVSRNLKEVMRILKRQPEMINRTLRKLNKMLQVLNDRIHKLETMEVTSSEDEESENIYCLLDRHRARAAKIYSKICELEGKAAHAGRATLQKFHFSGRSGYPKIEHALERYFNKTRLFPDFFDVKKLIEITVEKEKLQIPPIQIHNIAQSVFLEFGNKLQRMRKCDDYTMMVDYLDDGTKDPALDNEELFRKLEENKKTMKREEEVLAQFVKKEVELKSKGEIKTDEEDAINDSEGDESEKEGELEKKSLEFSDTEDELINEEVEESNRKRRLSSDSETLSLLPHKRSMTELNQMEVNLKLVRDVEESRVNARRRNSAEKDVVMDQLGLASKGKQRRI